MQPTEINIIFCASSAQKIRLMGAPISANNEVVFKDFSGYKLTDSQLTVKFLSNGQETHYIYPLHVIERVKLVF